MVTQLVVKASTLRQSVFLIPSGAGKEQPRVATVLICLERICGEVDQQGVLFSDELLPLEPFVLALGLRSLELLLHLKVFSSFLALN